MKPLKPGREIPRESQLLWIHPPPSLHVALLHWDLPVSPFHISNPQKPRFTLKILSQQSHTTLWVSAPARYCLALAVAFCTNRGDLIPCSIRDIRKIGQGGTPKRCLVSLSLLVNISESLPAPGRLCPVPLSRAEWTPFLLAARAGSSLLCDKRIFHLWVLVAINRGRGPDPHLVWVGRALRSTAELYQYRSDEMLYSWNPHKIFEPMLFPTLLGHL